MGKAFFHVCNCNVPDADLELGVLRIHDHFVGRRVTHVPEKTVFGANLIILNVYENLWVRWTFDSTTLNAHDARLFNVDKESFGLICFVS